MAKHFLPEEIEGLDLKLVGMLDDARDRAGVPFVITSGKRSHDANLAAGGVEDSSHLRGLAVDIQCLDATIRFFMLVGIVQAGFRRIGIYDRHIHCDCDESLPQNVIWTGVSH